ncbi:MAG: aldose 1-epimerase family protein [Eubacteriales bacterium]|nr:aldose 1-epimerase family protein [Eubacteriales bacterium]
MIYTLENECLRVQVNSRGGELWSVQTGDGSEYLWQGDPAYWGDRALNLFPYIARLTQGKYTLDGKTYEMPIHGFVNSSELQAEEHSPARLVLKLTDSEETREMYPFHFVYWLIYELKKNALEITFAVENNDSRRMYFGVGGHPGFAVPLEKGLAFEDYCLRFDADKNPVRVGFSEDCFVNGADSELVLKDGRVLPLTHSMFDQDAIVLRDMAKAVTLCSEKGSRSVRVEYPQMDYLGIWHMPFTDAPYICIEPWSSLPSRKDVIEDLAKQENLISLPAGERYENRWRIVIN